MILNLYRLLFAPPRDLILLVLAGWLGLLLADRRARASIVGEKAFDTLVFSMTAGFVIGGRILFLASHWSAFVGSPLSVFSPNRDVFDLWGAMAAATIVAVIVVQRRHLPALETLDLLAPLFASLAVGLSLSHLASGAAFGSEAHLPWSIELWGAQRHPTQLYELVAAWIALGIVWYGRPLSRPGSRFLLWLALAAASRLITEAFRGDSTLVFGGLRLAQIIAWAVLAIALLGLEWLRGRNGDQTKAQRSAEIR